MKRFSGSLAVARHQVFILHNGTYVVQWDSEVVQDLLSGNYLDFDERQDYGRLVNDYDLKQLINAGRVERYNRQYVWLMPLPERNRFGQQRVLDGGDRIRAFYLITQYNKSQLESVRDVLNRHFGEEALTARVRDNRVVILGQHGLPFRKVADAEDVQAKLQDKVPDVFVDLTMAFIELSSKSSANRSNSTMDNETSSLNLNDIIASQSDNKSLVGKRVVIAIPQDEERAAFSELLTTMKIDMSQAASAAEALQLLEDHPAQLLIMDIQQPDMHGWMMINKIREIGPLRDLPITVITDKADMSMTVAKVDYLNRPVSIARLRHSIWMALKNDPTDLS